jgi:hypothetical protein
MTVKGRFLLASPLVLLFALGCSPDNPNAPASLSGKVTYNNKPVTGGSVAIIAKDGGTIVRPIMQDGTYSATDLPVGEAAITVETETVNPDRKMPEYGGGRKDAVSPRPAGAPGSATGSGAYVKIPDKYSKKETSGFSTNLKAGRNTMDLPLAD